MHALDRHADLFADRHENSAGNACFCRLAADELEVLVKQAPSHAGVIKLTCERNISAMPTSPMLRELS